MGFEPTSCPDCPYPCNFIVTALTKKDYEDNKQRYDIRCRKCSDHWIEIDDNE